MRAEHALLTQLETPVLRNHLRERFGTFVLAGSTKRRLTEPARAPRLSPTFPPSSVFTDVYRLPLHQPRFGTSIAI